MSDLAAGRIALEFGKRKRCWAGDHTVHRQPPVSETSFLKLAEDFVLGGLAVGEWRLRNLAARELAGGRVARQYPLRSIGKGFARAIEAAMIGRDQSITLGKAGGHG